MPGTRDYEDFLDQQIILLMFDNQILHGILRSFDQFNNIILENCKLVDSKKETFKKMGLFLVRGENIIFMGIRKINFRKYREVIE